MARAAGLRRAGGGAAGQHCCGLPAIDRGAGPGPLAGASDDRDARVGAGRLDRHRGGELRDRDDPRSAASLPGGAGLARALRSAGGSYARPDQLPGAGRGLRGRGSGDQVRAQSTYHSFCQSTNVLGIGGLAPELLRDVCGLDLASCQRAKYVAASAVRPHWSIPGFRVKSRPESSTTLRQTGAQILVTDNRAARLPPPRCRRCPRDAVAGRPPGRDSGRAPALPGRSLPILLHRHLRAMARQILRRRRSAGKRSHCRAMKARAVGEGRQGVHPGADEHAGPGHQPDRGGGGQAAYGRRGAEDRAGGRESRPPRRSGPRPARGLRGPFSTTESLVDASDGEADRAGANQHVGA